MTLQDLLTDLPLIAILRGVTPDEVVAVGRALIENGFRCIEVPLNSPEPFESIRRLADAMGEVALIGAGTVLDPLDAARLADAGGRLAISPDANPEVIRAAKAAGLVSLPAFLSPTEALRALAAGADGLKLFPAEIAGPAGLKAVRAVLPAGVPVFPVGGIDTDTMAGWRGAGASGFGFGGALYSPGRSPQDVGRRARDLVAAYRAAGF